MSPVVEPVNVRSIRRAGIVWTRIVTVSCCYCGGEHSHGWPPADDNVGRRRAHCSLGDYLIATPGEAA